MTPEQRRNASTDITLNYLASYYISWRLAKVLTLKKVHDQRHEFYREMAMQVRQVDDGDGIATISQEIRHGLHLDAIAECVQYIEDLFTLIQASKKPDFFVKNLLSNKAGNVTPKIKTFVASDSSVGNALHFPVGVKFPTEKDQNAYDTGVANAVSMMSELVKFYKDYEFFYIQYKHGLTVAMRPFNTKYGEEQILKDKAGEMEPSIAVYDCFNLKDASKKGTFSAKKGVMVPFLTENSTPVISQLIQENNYARLVFTEDINLNMDKLVDIAQKAKACIYTFMWNYAQTINPTEKDVCKRQLPADYKNDKYVMFKSINKD